MSVKPILFGLKKVQAVKSGSKTAALLPIKPQPSYFYNCVMGEPLPVRPGHFGAVMPDKTEVLVKPPFWPGDILWMKEAWAHPSDAEIAAGADPGRFLYRADCPNQPCAWGGWKPPVSMPPEAARIFLRVVDVKVKRLHDVTSFECIANGIPRQPAKEDILKDFAAEWARSIKPADRASCSWGANPWIWVVSFKRIVREEAMRAGSKR